MKLGIVKNIVGANLVGLHVLAIGLCFYWLDAKLSAQDFRIVVLILCPVTAVYAMAYCREAARSMFVDVQDPDDRRLVTRRFAILAIFLTFVFSAGIIYTIHQYSLGKSLSPDDLKDRLGIMETALGGFLGLIVETLFGKAPPAKD